MTKIHEDELLVERQKKMAEREQKKNAENIAMMSVRERLERKLETDKVVIHFDDSDGGFDATFKKLSAKQQERIAQILNSEMKSATDDDAQARLTDELYNLVGGASMDSPPLDADFWKDKSKYSYGDFLAIVMKIAAASSTPDPKYMEEIKKFRIQ